MILHNTLVKQYSYTYKQMRTDFGSVRYYIVIKRKTPGGDFHDFHILIQGYMDDEFGPTAEWDWGDQGRLSEVRDDGYTDDVSYFFTSLHRGCQTVVTI